MRSRIVFASSALGVWGAERSMLTFAAEVRDAGHEILLICVSDDLADAWRSATDSEAHRIESPVSTGRRSLIQSFWQSFRELLTAEDQLILFSYVLAPGAIVPRRWRQGRPPVTLDLHDTLTPVFGRFALGVSALGLHRVVAVSDYTLRQLPWRRQIGRVLTRPVRPLAFRLPESMGNSLRVGVVGRVSPQKNLDLAIEAAALAPNIELVVRGDEEDREYASYIRRRLHERLGSRARMEPARKWEEALDGLDVLVVANPTEPMGRTVLEAQLRGVIAVAPDQGGSAELVVNGVTGYVYAADDPESLATVFRRLREEDTGSVIRSARDWASEQCDPSSYARRYLHALNV